MKNMKGLIAILMTACMSLTLVGCGTKQTTTTAAVEDYRAEETTETETKGKTVASNSTKDSKKSTTDESSNTVKTDEAEEDETISEEEGVKNDSTEETEAVSEEASVNTVTSSETKASTTSKATSATKETSSSKKTQSATTATTVPSTTEAPTTTVAPTTKSSQSTKNSTTKATTVAPTTKAATKSTTAAPATVAPTTAHSHTWNSGVVTTGATCQHAGVKTYTCACGATRTESIAQTDHDWYLSSYAASTCTTAGYNLYTCSMCGANYTDVLPLIDHSYFNGYCVYCGAKNTNVTTPEPTSANQQAAHNAMMALEAQYPTGTQWTNNNAYNRRYFEDEYYMTGYGCAGFAYILQDAAMDAVGSDPENLNACHITYDLSHLYVGDIVRVNNDSHSVIITQINGDGTVVYAEGNFCGIIRWGVTTTQAELIAEASYIKTMW